MPRVTAKTALPRRSVSPRRPASAARHRAARRRSRVREAFSVGRDLRCRDAVDLWQDVRLGIGARHAKAGDPWTISGYLGNGGQFDDAMGKFALAYADQAEKDHAALKAAVRAGIVEVQLEH